MSDNYLSCKKHGVPIIEFECPFCEGSGEWLEFAHGEPGKCESCNGTGRERVCFECADEAMQ